MRPVLALFLLFLASSRAHAQAEEEPLAAPEVSDAKEVEAPAKKRGFSRSLGGFARAIEAGPWLGIASRNLRFRDDLFDRVGDYRLSATPSMGAHARVYPFTRLSVRGLRDVGLAARGARDFIEASSAGGVDFQTHGATLELDMLYRLPLGRFQLGAWLGYTRRTFSVDAALASPGQDNLPRVPDVRYQGARLGLEGRARVTSALFVDLRLSYVGVASAGAIHGPLWFPHGAATGLGISAEAAYRVTSFMDVRLGLSFDRFAHQLNPALGDRYAVFGAADRFTKVGLGVGFYR